MPTSSSAIRTSITACLLVLIVLGTTQATAAVATFASSSTSLSTSQYGDAVMADNPAAYWRLGEASGAAAADEKGANAGTYLGGVGLGQPGALTGEANTSASFDGVDDYVNVPNSASLNATSGVTVEAWVKRTKSGVWQNVVAKSGSGAAAAQNYALWINTANKPVLYFGNGSASGSVTAPAAIDTNWHHLVATYDNANAKIYVDGVLKATAASNVPLTANTQVLTIGRSVDGLRVFGGLIDEVAVYTSVLSLSSIQAHYNVGTSPDTTPPAVSLTAPANGATTGATPTFSGAAGTAPGDSSTITVNLYSGSDPSGTLVQTLTTTHSGGSWSVPASAELPDGTYTARAEQLDGASNLGLSAPSTFTTSTADIVPPAVSLTAPANGATTGPTPTFSGAAGTAPGDSSTITVNVYSGSDPSGTLEQTLTTTQSSGSWSVPASAELPDGTYTARAEQLDDASNLGLSTPSTFTVTTADITPPAVSLTEPANGASTGPTPTFSGAAGTAPGDSSAITVKVYSGSAPSGTLVQTLTTTQSGGSWSVAAISALVAGTYTAQAEQLDGNSNLGQSSANTFSVSSPYRAAVMADNPAAYWRLGEASGATAVDEKGANAGTYLGGVGLGQPGALQTGTNTSASFDGVDDYVSVPNSGSLGATSGVTVEAWVKRTKSGVWQNVVAKSGSGGAAAQNYALWINTANKPVLYFGNGGNNSGSVTAPAAIDTNWHHLVATYDEANAKIYVDGVLKVTAASNVSLTANTQVLTIGRSVDGLRIFGGLIDEVAVYTSALSLSSIQAHYSAAASFDTTPPAITLTAPDNGATTAPTPTFSGAAGPRPATRARSW